MLSAIVFFRFKVGVLYNTYKRKARVSDVDPVSFSLVVYEESSPSSLITFDLIIQDSQGNIFEYLSQTNFSKYYDEMPTGELTLTIIESRYASKNEKEVFENHHDLLNLVMIFFVGLLEKVCLDETIDESINEDLKRLWNFENKDLK